MGMLLYAGCVILGRALASGVGECGSEQGSNTAVRIKPEVDNGLECRFLPAFVPQI